MHCILPHERSGLYVSLDVSGHRSEFLWIQSVSYTHLDVYKRQRSPVFVNATTDGVVLIPSAFVITVGFPPSITATQLFVVPDVYKRQL